MEIKGKIKKYNAEKGYGFISYEDDCTEKDIFFHKSDIITKDTRPAEGLEVSFTPGDGKKGPAARKIKICGSGETACPPYCMPADTLKITDPLTIDNISLFLNKTAYFDGKKFCHRLDEIGREIRLKPERYRGVPFSQLVERRRAALREMGLACEAREMQVDWRLAVGLGCASVYETAMTLHHVYGAPYLPGSAVKGVTRNMVVAEFFGSDEGDSQRGALADPGFCLIFGSPENSVAGARRGVAHFFDAFPFTAPTLRLDVMNLHYSPYYTGDQPPADYHDPKPISFLTVEKTTFMIWVGVEEKENRPVAGGVFDGKTPLAVAVEWMERAMKEQGVGAKTSVGYGYFV
ncbi:MAG TPA: type III-B CRISPR module RAMP protein Cmr6 [Bacillota bacterium]|nr:type III-B CRISPR module RAMP protein Cmr6 [Bacillota bacterium]